MVVRLKQLGQDAATNGQVPTWSTANGQWEPADGGGGATSALIARSIPYTDDIPAVTPPTPNTTGTDLDTLDFPISVVTGQKIEFDVPDDYSSGDIDIIAVWRPSANGTGSTFVRIETTGEVADISGGDVDAIGDSDLDITVLDDVTLPITRTVLRSISGASFGVGDHVLVNIKRLGTEDDYAGSWRLMGLQYRYTGSVANDITTASAQAFFDADGETPPSSGTMGTDIATLDYAPAEAQKTTFIVPDSWDEVSDFYCRIVYGMSTAEASKTVTLETFGEIASGADGVITDFGVFESNLLVANDTDVPHRVAIRAIPAGDLNKGDEITITFARRASTGSEHTGDLQLVSMTATYGVATASSTPTTINGGVPLYRITGDGLLATATKVDAAVAVQTFTITGIKAYRGTAGSSSSTIVDVNIDGSTLFQTQANRPTFASTDGDNKIITKVPDATWVPSGSLLTFDVDQVEAGSPADLVIEIYGTTASLDDISTYTQKDSQEIGEWLPASANNVNIDTEGLYDLTDKVMYKRVVGNAAAQDGGFATGFIVPEGVSAIDSVVIEYKASIGSVSIDVDVVDTGGSATTSGVSSPSTSKALHSFTTPSGTFAEGLTCYVLVKCGVGSAESVSISRILVNWATTPTSELTFEKDSNEVGVWLPASANNVDIDSEGLYDLTDKVLYKRCEGQDAAQDGGFAMGFIVPEGALAMASVKVEYKASVGTVSIDVDVIDTGGSVATDSVSSPSTSIATHTFSTPSGSFDAGKTAYVLVKCGVDNAEIVSLSKITVTWS